MVSWETFAYWAQFSAMTPLDRENILSIFHDLELHGPGEPEQKYAGVPRAPS